MITPGSSRGKEVRSQALASVTQDMSSSRLRILGDLMESRKRAEQHEQEFLRTIHSENAAFSQIVSLFESSIEDVRSESSKLNEETIQRVEVQGVFIDELKSRLGSEISERFESISSEITRDKDVSTKSMDSVRVELAKTKAELDHLLTAVPLIKGQLESQGAETRRLLDDFESRISSMGVELAKTGRLVEASEERLERKIEGAVEEFTKRLDSLPSELEGKLSVKIIEAESRLRALIDARVGGTEEQQESRTRELIEEACTSLEMRIENISMDSKRASAAATESAGQLAQRLDGLSAPVPSLTEEKIGNLFEEMFEKKFSSPKTDSSELEKEIKNLRNEVLNLSQHFSRQLEAHAKTLKAVSLAGYRHEWKIVQAASKFKSLGLLSAPNKFVNSESFSIGPYENLQLRVFPVSTQTSDQPTVWLIHRPESYEAVVPIFVDLAVGSSKRGPIKLKKVQELFGHWVWEAHFVGDILSELDEEGSLIISAEVSMRQWTDLRGLNPPTTYEEKEDVPDSPSGMSSYTFAGPLKPLPTNPFEQSDNRGPLTPRRSSWAQFGTPELVALNPFK